MNSPTGVRVSYTRHADIRAVIRYTLSISLLIIGLGFVSTTSADVDLWGHLRFGLDMLEARRIDLPDQNAFTSDRNWINHEWLSEVMFAIAWHLAGQTGLILFKLAAIAGMLWFVRRTLALTGVSPRGQFVLVALTIAGTLPRIVHVRPQLFSVLLFAALGYVLVRAAKGHRLALASSPLILGLWANLHGGWIVGLATLGMWTALDLCRQRREGIARFDGLAWTALAAACTLLNPYTTDLWGFLSDTVRPGREAITEWHWILTSPTSALMWLLLAAMGGRALLHAGRSRYLDALIPAFWGLAALVVVRLDAFFTLAVVLFLGAPIDRLLGRKTAQPFALSPALRGAVVAVIVATTLTIPQARHSVTCIQLYERWWPEPDAVSFIRDNQLAGNFLMFFNWGEYAIWHLSPAVKVSIDGRRETVYSDEVLANHFALYAGRREGLDYVRRLGADYAWLPRMSAGARALQRHGWTTVFEGPRSVVLAAPGQSIAPIGPTYRLASTASTAAPPRCFPGP